MLIETECRCGNLLRLRQAELAEKVWLSIKSYESYVDTVHENTSSQPARVMIDTSPQIDREIKIKDQHRAHEARSQIYVRPNSKSPAISLDKLQAHPL